MGAIVKGGEMHRLWIVSEDVPLTVIAISESNEHLQFGPVKMKCCCRRTSADPMSRSGISDADDDGRSSAHKFAAQFTQNYDAIAQKYPHFERLRNLAKLVQLAKWLKSQRQLGIDLHAILDAMAARNLPTVL
jgi:hypothetical protein